MSTEAPAGTIPLYNAHSLSEHIPLVVAGHGSHSDAALLLMRPKGQKQTKIKAPTAGMGDDRTGVAKGWAAMMRATGITDWSYLAGLDCYVPTGTDVSGFRLRVGRGAEDKWQRLNPKPAPFGPCGVGMARDEGRWTSFSTCWRPRSSAGGKCPLHEKADQRDAAKQAEWQARLAEERAERARDNENRQRAEEALSVLRAAVGPLGIHPDQIDTAHGTVRLQPEVAEAVAQFLTEYDELRNL